MKRYYKAYNIGFKIGKKDARIDYLNNNIKNFKKIDDKEIKALLYDIGYIKGYNKFIKSSLNSNKNII